LPGNLPEETCPARRPSATREAPVQAATRIKLLIR